jgi:hypothetical protein
MYVNSRIEQRYIYKEDKKELWLMFFIHFKCCAIRLNSIYFYMNRKN